MAGVELDMTAPRAMTVGELRTCMLTLDSADVPDDAEVLVRVQDDDGCTHVGALCDVTITAGCTDVDALVLDGSSYSDDPGEE